MVVLVRRSFLREWIRAAVLSNDSYHQTRSQLWGQLLEQIAECMFPAEEAIQDTVDVGRQFLRLKQFLTAQDDELHDAMKLAYVVALNELIGLANASPFANLALH